MNYLLMPSEQITEIANQKELLHKFLTYVNELDLSKALHKVKYLQAVNAIELHNESIDICVHYTDKLLILIVYDFGDKDCRQQAWYEMIVHPEYLLDRCCIDIEAVLANEAYYNVADADSTMTYVFNHSEAYSCLAKFFNS